MCRAISHRSLAFIYSDVYTHSLSHCWFPFSIPPCEEHMKVALAQQGHPWNVFFIIFKYKRTQDKVQCWGVELIFRYWAVGKLGQLDQPVLMPSVRARWSEWIMMIFKHVPIGELATQWPTGLEQRGVGGRLKRYIFSLTWTYSSINLVNCRRLLIEIPDVARETYFIITNIYV